MVTSLRRVSEVTGVWWPQRLSPVYVAAFFLSALFTYSCNFFCKVFFLQSWFSCDFVCDFLASGLAGLGLKPWPCYFTPASLRLAAASVSIAPRLRFVCMATRCLIVKQFSFSSAAIAWILCLFGRKAQLLEVSVLKNTDWIPANSVSSGTNIYLPCIFFPCSEITGWIN